MDLIHALGTALSGINAAQANLGIVAGNVANAQTPGYVARSAAQIATTSGDGSESVRIASINRLLDGFVQAQLRTETAGGAYADVQAKFYQQLQQVYGQPGTDASLDGVFNKFTTAVQALATTPSSASVQAATINAAQALVQQLNSATLSIQGLRTQADQGIADDVQKVNQALKQIADINQHVAGTNANDSAAAALEDQRDQAIDQIASLLDIRVSLGSDNQVSICNHLRHVAADAKRGQHAQLHRGRDRHRDPAMECESVQEHAEHDFADGSGRVDDRSGRQPRHSFRRDRRLPQPARLGAGAGAGPGRRTRGADVESALGHDDRGNRGIGTAAVGILGRSRQRVPG